MATRMVASTRIVGRADSIRRTQNSAASTTPSAEQQAGQRPQRRDVLLGDRTVDDLLDHQREGQAAHHRRRSAVTALPISAGRAGRANGSSR